MRVGQYRLRRRDFHLLTPRRAPLGYLEYAGWLARGVLWVSGWLTSDSSEPLDVSVQIDGVEREVVAHRFSHPRSDLARIHRAAGQILVVPLEMATGARSLDALYVAQGGDWYRWTGRKGLNVRLDLAAYILAQLGGLTPENKGALRRFLDEQCSPSLPANGDSDPMFQCNWKMVDLVLAPNGDAPATDRMPAGERPAAELEAAGEEEQIENPATEDQPDEESRLAAEARPADEHQPAVVPPDAGQPADPNRVASAGDQPADADPSAEDEEGLANDVQPAGALAEDEGAEPAEIEPLDSEEDPPPYSADPARPLGLCIDRVIAIDTESLYLQGWFWDAESVVDQIELVSPSGERLELLGNLATVERADIVEMYRPVFGERAGGRHGFAGLVEVGGSFFERRKNRLELRVRRGEPVTVGAPIRMPEPLAFRDELFQLFSEHELRHGGSLEQHLHPTHQRLQARCRRAATARRILDCGELPTSPRASLVIPLFRQLDLIEHQLAQLADDPTLRDCEILYVLDSPEMEQHFESTIFHLARLYRLPIRGIVANANVGYAAASNLGAAHARGRLLVLMHSDVLADRPGWLDELARAYDSKERVGVLGPKLLFEDGSIQHAGTSFSRDLKPDGLWSNLDRFKGLPRHSPGAIETRRVPAVSGACLMIERDLFERVGGLREVYVAGDFEDADLCLRCAEEGLESRYLPAVELFHLEGLSHQPGPGWRRNATSQVYNRWLLNHRWDERISSVMNDVAGTDE